MNPRNRVRCWVVTAVVAAVVGGIGGGYALWRSAQARAAWRTAVPVFPAPAEVGSHEWRQRRDALTLRLAAWPPDLAALGEWARVLHANGHVPEAGQAYRALLERDPGDPRWPHLLGVLLASYGRLEEAEPWFARAAELAPTAVAPRRRAADTALKLNRASVARAAYEAVLALAPGDPYAQLGLARLEIADGRWTAARARLQQTVAAQPEFSAAQSLLATVHERLGNTADAIVARERAGAAGRFREAPDPWAEALLDECFDVYRLQVAAAALASPGAPDEDVRRARAVLARALRLDPDDARSHRQLGNLHARGADLPAARQHLERASALAPADPAAWLDLIALLRRMGENAALAPTVAAALAACPGEAGLHFERARLASEAGLAEEALVHLAEASRLDPRNTGAARQQALVLTTLGRGEEARAVLIAALAVNPGDGPTWLALASQAVAAGEPGPAADGLARARAAGVPAPEVAVVMEEFRRRFGRAAF